MEQLEMVRCTVGGPELTDNSAACSFCNGISYQDDQQGHAHCMLRIWSFGPSWDYVLGSALDECDSTGNA